MKRYIKASFDNPIPDWLRKDKRALSALNRAGIDLKSVVITDAPTGRGKDYPIHYLKDGWSNIVWIPGIYNDGNTMQNPRTGGYEQLKYIPKKYLDIIETVYLNKEDYRKSSNIGKYKDPRYIYDREGNSEYGGQYQYEERNWDTDTVETKWSKLGKGGRYSSQRDKSGYVIPKLSERLREFYEQDADGSRIIARIDKLHDKLTDLKSRIFDVEFESFGKDRQGEYDYSSTSYPNMLSRFGDACRDYKIALHVAQTYAGKSNKDRYNYFVDNAIDYVKSAERSIKDIERVLDTQYY